VSVHETFVRECLGRGKPGEALVYLAQQLDAAPVAGPEDPWAVDPPALNVTPMAQEPGQMRDTLLKDRAFPLWESGPELQANDFGWDGDPDTWTKDIGAAMYARAIELIGDPQPGDTGEYAARRQLIQDLRTPPTREVLYIKGETIGNAGYVSGETDEAVTVGLPPTNDEQREWRREFALQLGWDKPDWLYPSGGSPIIESFVEGGPLLMFHGYREYLGQLPAAYLQRMIQHHADCGFPMDAALMTADLLRAEDTLDYEQALNDAGRRSATLPGGKGTG